MIKNNNFSKKAFILAICLAISIQVLSSSLVIRCFAQADNTVTDFASLQAAIDNNTGTPIEIANDIDLTGVIVITKSLTFKTVSTNSVKLTATDNRHFSVGGGDITITFDGNVILDGDSSAGGIYSTASNLVLDNAVIRNCAIAMNGGGIFATRNVTVANCTFSNNSGGTGGGGAIWSSSDLTIHNSEFTTNTSFVGAGVYAVGSVNVFNSTFTGNVASGAEGGGTGSSGGGAIYARSNIVVDTCTISDNKAGNGGGICSYQSTPNDTIIIKNGTKIIGNQSLNSLGSCGGGGIYSTNSRVIIEDGELIGNTSVTGGGAIYSDGGLIVTGGIISQNTAGTGGGAARVYGPLMNVSGGEISNNTAGRYGGAIMTGADNATISGDVRIVDNLSNGTGVYDGGGGLSLYYCTLTVSGGEISGNIAAHANGGGIGDYWGSAVNVMGGTIIGNHAPEGNGGGIYITDLAKVTAASDALFSDNTASRAFWMTDPGDIALHNTNIHTASRSAPPAGNRAFTYLFNNYDANYTKGNTQDLLPLFSITVTDDGNGTASSDKSVAHQDETITLTAAPHTGYKLKEWIVISGNIEIINSDGTFIMPDSDVVIQAIFEPILSTEPLVYTVTYNDDGANGTPPISAIYPAETIVTVAGPNTLNLSGHTFVGWRDDSGKFYAEGGTFTIISDVTLYALWNKISVSDGGKIIGTPSAPQIPNPEPNPADTFPKPPTPSVPGHNIISGENGTYIEIGEAGVPLGIWKLDKDAVWIYEELPPLSSNPGTGRSNFKYLFLSGICLVLSSLFIKLSNKKTNSG